MSLSPTTETYYVGVYSSLTASCAFHLTAQVTRTKTHRSFSSLDPAALV
jgi:hypothetical protein